MASDEKMRKTAKNSQCENCRNAVEVFGLARPIIICDRKSSSEGKYNVVWQNEACKNYEEKESSNTQGEVVADDDNVRFIPLTKGKFAIVDADDYDWLNRHKWCISKKRYSFYACRQTHAEKIFMHRVITNAPKGMLVDHIDGNGLNNRRSNLRICTIAQNNRNSRPWRRSYSKYKGVSWCQAAGKWRARIRPNHKQIHLGCFDTQIEAARAYDKKAKELFGEFAYLNFNH